MTGYAKATVAISLIAVVAEVALAVAVVPTWSPGGVNPVFLVFLAGPLAFLALLAWRRREHPIPSRFLFRMALLLAVPGLGVLLYDYMQFQSEQPGEHAHPLIVALVQWVVLLVVWALLVIREGRAKRAREAAEKKA